ncbi:MAG: hypothetical protein Q7O66_17480 [Dehalococcoidia bacterium]|nr:hypothetical protein [Dehalococcoidia bacterium]
MHTETQKAYLAGLLDGEGNIAIPTIPTKRGTTRHTLDVRITNTAVAVLQEIGAEWGSKIAQIRKRHIERGYKETGDLRWSTQSAAIMLREIRPYLRIKAQQADIALLLMETLRPREHRTVPLTDEEWSYREQLRLQLRVLNRRGGDAAAAAIPTPEKPTLTCQYCGTEFNTYQKLRKYCSQKCAMAAGRDAYVDRHTYTKVCLGCGQTFTARMKQLYCSVKCGRKMQPPPVPKGTKRSRQ